MSGGHQWPYQLNGRPLLCYSGVKLPYHSLYHVPTSSYLNLVPTSPLLQQVPDSPFFLLVPYPLSLSPQCPKYLFSSIFQPVPSFTIPLLPSPPCPEFPPPLTPGTDWAVDACDARAGFRQCFTRYDTSQSSQCSLPISSCINITNITTLTLKFSGALPVARGCSTGHRWPGQGQGRGKNWGDQGQGWGNGQGWGQGGGQECEVRSSGLARERVCYCRWV